MISNVLNILRRWCTPLGEMILPTDYVMVRSGSATLNVVITTTSGKVIARYLRGGVMVTETYYGSPVSMSLTPDSNAWITLYSDDIVAITANDAANIVVYSSTATQIEVDAPIKTIQIDHAPAIENILLNDYAPGLYSIRAHVNYLSLQADIINTCQMSLYGGQKRLYMGVDDAFYAATKAGAEAAGWTVYNI